MAESYSYPRKVVLRGGETVSLVTIDAPYEEALVSFFCSLPRPCTEFLKDDVGDADVVRTWVKQRDLERVWSLLAIARGGRVVGDATLHMTQFGWARHVGEVRVVVHPDFQRKGLATALIHDIVNRASVAGLGRLEAQMLVEQTGARRAFERFGFREEARLKHHAKDILGRTHDVLILTSTVDDLWAKMEDLNTELDLSSDGH